MFITHAGARAVWDTPRMKPDDVLRAVAATGGVIGMSAAPHTTLSAEHSRHTIESVMDHFRYIADLVGIEHVAFGPDTLYGRPRRAAPGVRPPARPGPGHHAGRRSSGSSTWTGWRTRPRTSPTSATGWSGTGTTTTTIRAVLGGNIYRALQSIWVSP